MHAAERQAAEENRRRWGEVQQTQVQNVAALAELIVDYFDQMKSRSQDVERTNKMGADLVGNLRTSLPALAEQARTVRERTHLPVLADPAAGGRRR